MLLLQWLSILEKPILIYRGTEKHHSIKISTLLKKKIEISNFKMLSLKNNNSYSSNLGTNKIYNQLQANTCHLIHQLWHTAGAAHLVLKNNHVRAQPSHLKKKYARVLTFIEVCHAMASSKIIFICNLQNGVYLIFHSCQEFLCILSATFTSS